jgi:hypothetical protein
MRLWVSFGADYHLNQTKAIAQINECYSAMIAASIHPPS